MTDFRSYVPLDLSRQERRVWNALAAERGRVVTRAAIKGAIGCAERISTEHMNITLKRLGRRIADGPAEIERVRLAGFRLVERH